MNEAAHADDLAYMQQRFEVVERVARDGDQIGVVTRGDGPFPVSDPARLGRHRGGGGERLGVGQTDGTEMDDASGKNSVWFAGSRPGPAAEQAEDA